MVSWRARCKASDVGVVAPRRLLHCTQSESCTIYTLCKNWLLHLTFPYAIISVYILLHFLQYTQCSAMHCTQSKSCTIYSLSAKTYIPVCNNIYLHFIAFFAKHPDGFCIARNPKAAQFIQHKLSSLCKNLHSRLQ